MASRRALGALGIASQNKAKDLPVLGPHQRALLGIIKHSAHRALQVGPLRRDSVFDCPVAGQTIKRGVKRDIGLDECQHRGIRTQREACSERLLCGSPLLGLDYPPSDAFGGELRGQCVERAADLIKLADSHGVDLRNDQPASAVLLDQFLLLEHLQRVADGLPRHPKCTAELFLPDALPGSKRAVGNRLNQPLIGAVDQRRLQIERSQANIPRA